MYEPLSLFNCFTLTPLQTNVDVQYHVGLVYRLLTEMIIFYSMGMYLGSISSVISYLSFIGTIVSLFFVLGASGELNLYLLHMSLASFLGASIGYSVKVLYLFDPSIVTNAVSMALVTFLSFTYAAKFVTSSHMVPFYGFLFSMLSGLFWLSIFKLFFGGTTYWFESCLALLTFSGFVTYDTFLMYNKFVAGNYNYYSHAINLFLDIANLFVRFLEYFANKNNNKKKKN